MLARVRLCRGDGIEENLDKYVTKSFLQMCDRGIPIVGFTYSPQKGCCIIGEKECFEEVFKDGVEIEDFDFEQYVLNVTDSDKFWTTELDPYDPMKSKLLKWVK